MAKKIKKTCCVCGKEYEIYCPTCREAINQPSWMNIFHDESCKKVYETSSAYLMGMMDAESAKRIFDKCDLSNKDDFKVKFKNVINEVYELTKVIEEEVVVESEVIEVVEEVVTASFALEEDVVDNNDIIELVTQTSEPVIVEEVVIEQTNYKKKKKKKKNKVIDSDLEK